MLELTRELHKKEYCNNEAIKLDFEAIKELIPFKIALKQGFYEAFECKVCGLGMMTELLGCGLKYSCNDCDNVETLKERKAFYHFNFQALETLLKESLVAIASNTKDFEDLKIKKNTSFWLATLEIWKINFYFFSFEKDFKTLKQKEGENYIIFTAFSEEETERQENIFFIDIYEFLELNILQSKIQINEMKLKYMIFKILAGVMLGISKSNKEFLKKAGIFWALYVANNKIELERYKITGGRELFLKDIKTEIPYLANDFTENLWKEKIKPKL